MTSKIWVCWERPPTDPSEHAVVLSFLTPGEEEDWVRQSGKPLIRSREACAEIREVARNLYVNLVANIGVVSYNDRMTFRRALSREGQASRWWYHPVSFKSPEVDPIFQWIASVLTIRAVAERHDCRKIVLFGAPREIARALRHGFQVVEWRTRRPIRESWSWLVGLGSRTKWVANQLQSWGAVKANVDAPSGLFEVFFSSFWNWSVCWDEKRHHITDRYLRRLPEELRHRGPHALGWAAWFAPDGEPGKKGRRLKEVLAPLKERKDVVILQSFLRLRDILRAVFDFGPLFAYLKLRRRAAFRKVFLHEGLDFYPLFSGRLLRGFLDFSLPYCDLVATAAERACHRYRPRLTVSFLEHFPHSRALYEGVKRSGIEILQSTIQHASYNHGKTFLFLHPTLEFRGIPDGCSVPQPDLVFAMGEFGRELFLECGYAPDQVVLTGSPRYDQVRLGPDGLPRQNGGAKAGLIRVLVAATLNVEMEIDLLEAVCSAARGLEGVKLLFRNHPMSQIERDARYSLYETEVELTTGSLDEDLSGADLILFTYSTVAEEAFVRGKPVWQWLPFGFDGSALAEVLPIPRFGSVNALRAALEAFQADPAGFCPDATMQRVAFQKLFYRGDGCSATRIAEILGRNLEKGQTAKQRPVTGAARDPISV